MTTTVTQQTSRTVHAVLIDAANRTITDVQIAPSLEEYYRLIGCDTITIGQHFPDGDVLFVDDNGMFNPKAFFKLEKDGPILAGNGLIVGPEVEDDSEEGFHVTDARTKAAYLGAWFLNVEEAMR